MGLQPEQHSVYNTLDIDTLTNILLSSRNRPEMHKEALSAMARISPEERRSRLVQVVEKVIAQAGDFDQDIMSAAFDLLATDPAPEAAEAMLMLLPSFSKAAMQRSNPLTKDFREYYYMTLMTRRRDGDMEMWQKQLNQFSGKTFVGILMDSAAESLVKVIKPLHRIDKLPRAERNKTLRTLLMRGYVLDAIKMMLGNG